MRRLSISMRRGAAVTALSLVFALLCGCASAPKPAPEKSSAAPAVAANAKLFDRIGGKPALEAVTDEFLARVSQDERINASFAGAHLPRLRQRLIELFCVATGGPCTYTGRDMKSSHAGMGISGAQFDALAGHFVATLDKFKVPEREKNELIALVVPMKKDIVEEP